MWKLTKFVRAPQKYVQDPDTLLKFYDEVNYLGKNFLFVSALPSTHEKIEKSFEGHDDTKRIYTDFGGDSTRSEIERVRKLVQEHAIDCIVGIGGGKAIDTAKTAAHFEKKPVAIVPTICATDAPCTGLAVIYKDDHSFDQYIFFPKNPEVVIVDTKVIVSAPVKYLISGMGDALATYYEARTCYRHHAPSLEGGGIMNAAMALCEKCNDVLMKDGYMAVQAAAQGILTPAVDAIIEANTYLSGVGADNGGLALAHSFYNGFTALEETHCDEGMHGRSVGFGTIVQLVHENADTEELDNVIRWCASVGLPVTLKEIGVTDKSRVKIGCEAACIEGETIHHMIGDVTPYQLEQAVLAADLLGQEILEEMQ